MTTAATITATLGQDPPNTIRSRTLWLPDMRTSGVRRPSSVASAGSWVEGGLQVGGTRSRVVIHQHLEPEAAEAAEEEEEGGGGGAVRCATRPAACRQAGAGTGRRGADRGRGPARRVARNPA